MKDATREPEWTPWERILLGASVIPLLLIFVVPSILKLSPRDKVGEQLTFASGALSAILLATGLWGWRRARKARQPRRASILLAAAVTAGVPLALMALLSFLELVTGGWSY